MARSWVGKGVNTPVASIREAVRTSAAVEPQQIKEFVSLMDSVRPAAQHACAGNQRPIRSTLRRSHGPAAASAGTVDRYENDPWFNREIAELRDYLVWRATRLTAQRADAEDLVQETLLKAYASFDRYREGTNLKAWLIKIMVNTWVDRFRFSQRRPTEQLAADFTESQLAAWASHANTSGDEASAEMQVLQSLPGDVELAVQNLPDDLRTALYYACVAGYRNTEIADLLNVPVGTVGSRLHRAKASVRDALQGPGFHP